MANNNDEKGLIPKYILDDIANAIRSKLKGQNKYKPGAMAEAIKSISSAYFDSNDEFYILSPEYWTIKVDNNLEHQAISYTTSARTDTKNMPDVYSAPKLVILPSIKANAGWAPGIINKTIDYDKHIITFSASSVKPIDGMMEDGVLLVYVKSGDNNLYKTMTVTHDDSTNSDTYTFSDPITATIDTPVRVVGTDSSTWTQLIDGSESDGKYVSSTGFEADCISKYNNTNDLKSMFTNTKFEYFKMPNLVDFERNYYGWYSYDRVLSYISSLKTVDFRNLEYINNSNGQTWDKCIVFCVNNSSLTDINFSSLKLARCELLSGSAITELNLEKLEKVAKMTSFPNVTTVTLPLLNTVYYDFLCDCPKLVNISLPELTSVGGQFLKTVNLLETVDCPKLTTIGGNCLNTNCANLKSINFPELVTASGEFINNQSSSNFTKVSLPKLQSAYYLLWSDTTLQTAEFPELLTVNYAFCGRCDSLTEISAPKLQTVGDDAFKYDPKLTTINAPELTSVGAVCITNNDLLETVDCPKLSSIGGDGLTSCPLLINISLPELTTVGGKFIIDNTLLETVDCPKLTTIGGDSLTTNCANLKSINFPELVKVGGEFIKNQSSSSFTKVSVPKITSVGGNFLANNTLLETVDCPALTTIGTSCLDSNCKNLKSINFPELVQVGNAFFNHQTSSDFTKISIPKLQSVPWLLYLDTALQTADFPELLTVANTFCVGCNSLTEISAPKLQTVGEAFTNCPKLTNISLPELTTAKGNFLINDNLLETVDCPKLSSISGNCLNSNNAKLKSINFPELQSVGKALLSTASILQKISLPKLKTIGNNALYDMANLTYADFGALITVNGSFAYKCPNLKTIIIRSTTVTKVSGSICDGKSSDCILYVPEDMISKYLADSKWSAVFDSDHIKPIADAPAEPADTTTTT